MISAIINFLGFIVAAGLLSLLSAIVLWIIAGILYLLALIPIWFIAGEEYYIIITDYLENLPWFRIWFILTFISLCLDKLGIPNFRTWIRNGINRRKAKRAAKS